jgi:hypothetical protein
MGPKYALVPSARWLALITRISQLLEMLADGVAAWKRLIKTAQLRSGFKSIAETQFRR